MTCRFFSCVATRELCSTMSTASSLRPFSPKIPFSLPPKIPLSKHSVSLKPHLFSSISIERLPTKAFAVSSSAQSAPTHSVEKFPPKLRDIVKQFQSVEDSKAKYQQLLFYGRNLTPLDPKFKTKENKVQGCVSQVWVRAYLDSDKNVHFEADSDSSLTKGLAALLVQGLSGQPVSEIAMVSPDFITLLGLQQSLTPSRNNGFLNMMLLMQKKALEIYKEAEEGRGVVDTQGPELENEVESSSSADITENDTHDSSSDTSEIRENRTNFAASLGSRGERIKEILSRELSPVELEIEDISHQHAGHAGVHRDAVETHFNVRIASDVFNGKSLVKRHRLVYDLLQDELKTGLHALSIVAKTPSEVNVK